MLISNSPKTIAAAEQLKLYLNNNDIVLKNALSVLKTEHVLLHVFPQDITKRSESDIDHEIEITLNRGFSTMVDKTETLSGYVDKLVGVIDYRLIATHQTIPVYQIKKFSSVLPVKKSFFTVRIFNCQLYGAVKLCN